MTKEGGALSVGDPDPHRLAGRHVTVHLDFIVGPRPAEFVRFDQYFLIGTNQAVPPLEC